MTIWMPRKKPLYAPMLATFGGGSVKGFVSGGITSTLGLDVSTPALNALAILASTPSSSDGWYYIQTANMSSPELVWCDMTTDGGGYMLVSYQSSADTRQFFYPNKKYNYPTGMTAGSGVFGSSVAEFTLPVQDLWFNGTPSSSTVICNTSMKMVHDTVTFKVPILANMDRARKVVYTSPENLAIDPGINVQFNSGWSLNNTSFPGVWSGLKGFTVMTSSVSVVSTPSNWLYSTSGYWIDCGPSTDTNVQSGNGEGTGSWTEMNNSGTSTQAYGLLNVDYNVSSASSASSAGTYSTLAHFIR